MTTTTPQESSTLVHSFPRGENEEVQLALTRYKGRFYIDLRLWFHNEGEEGFKPTKKGIAFSVDHLEDLENGVRQLSEACSKLKTDSVSPDHQPRPSGNMQRRQPSAWAQRKQA